MAMQTGEALIWQVAKIRSPLPDMLFPTVWNFKRRGISTPLRHRRRRTIHV